MQPNICTTGGIVWTDFLCSAAKTRGLVTWLKDCLSTLCTARNIGGGSQDLIGSERIIMMSKVVEKRRISKASRRDVMLVVVRRGEKSAEGRE